MTVDDVTLSLSDRSCLAAPTRVGDDRVRPTESIPADTADDEFPASLISPPPLIPRIFPGL